MGQESPFSILVPLVPYGAYRSLNLYYLTTMGWSKVTFLRKWFGNNLDWTTKLSIEVILLPSETVVDVGARPSKWFVFTKIPLPLVLVQKLCRHVWCRKIPRVPIIFRLLQFYNQTAEKNLKQSSPKPTLQYIEVLLKERCCRGMNQTLGTKTTRSGHRTHHLGELLHFW